MDLNSTSDADLLSSYLDGDANAFRVLEQRYRKPLFAWLTTSLGNRSDAEDLYQDVWYKIIQKAESFKDVSFKAWIWKIARNKVIDFRRKNRPDLILDETASEDDQPMVEKLASADGGPAIHVETDDLTRKVLLIVGTLPDNQREVFLMRLQGHMSFNEIAEALEIPLNTALGRMHDAMKKIKKQMAEVIG